MTNENIEIKMNDRNLERSKADSIKTNDKTEVEISKGINVNENKRQKRGGRMN